MSGYQRINFKDQNVERPKTYDVTNNPDGSITLIESFGNVEELGTPINQENMNHIEDGIDAVSFSKFNIDSIYKKDDLITDIQDDELKIFKSLKDNNFGHLPSEKDYWEEVEIAGGKGSGFNLFDTKISDHILEGKEAKGWALQGTYVSGALYPDFYNKCLEQKTSATETSATLGSSTLTMFVNDNGHQFFNIADKSIVDTFYNTYGIADFYGIDEENERVFLPRNKYFAVTGEVPVAGNGMTLGITNGTTNYGLYAAGVGSDGNSGAIRATSNTYGTSVGSSGSGMCTLNKSYGITTDPTKSGIEAKLTPNENKYLYYCVGNTEVTQAITNVTEVTTSENDTIPLFTGMYFDFKPNNVSWLKAGVQQNNAGIYKACYDTLVEIVNGVNNYDLKVINQADMVSGVIYDEYWILDQDNYTFKTPIRTSERVLIECKVATDNDSTWYNLYSDGWLEQGGQLKSGTDSTPVSFLKSYKNLSYTLSYAQGSNDTNHDGSIDVIQTSTRTIGGFIVNKYLADVTSFWQACGYADVPTSNNLYFKVANAVQNLELLDAGKVLEAVADKISRQDCPAYIVETYKNGTSWYRIYSDGWCEQGGNISMYASNSVISLLKPFSDNNYNVLICFGGTVYRETAPSVSTKIANSFKVAHDAGLNNDFSLIWEAKGYMV